MRLVGISEIVRNSREVPGAGPQSFARLVQPAPLDEPPGTEPDSAPEQPLETALGDRESLAHLRDLTDAEELACRIRYTGVAGHTTYEAK